MGFLALVTFACAALIPTIAGKATPTPTGQIGAIEIGTPGLKGNKRDFQIWSGTITSQTSRQYMSNGSIVNTCNTNWITDLDFAVDSAGDVSGTGDAKLAGARTCSPQSNLVANTSEMSLSIHGQKDSTAFTLYLALTRAQPSPSADFGGYMLLMNNGTCPAAAKSVQVPLTGISTAQANLDLSGVLSGCGGSTNDIMNNTSLVRLQFRFKCSDIPADMNDPALKQLCQ
jgi:hypothetical protein